ncbi:hypothetical protein BDD14_4254 [Edaphobacter modestus]|uniref:Uncharacterized protein n=1 Tax=Edaphobacter modestus TaxID=388466 RepID=A0A4Q7YZJ7_9BACT|nr:hypothetical protein BDD14_4254 [Edaphobacter modestus]
MRMAFAIDDMEMEGYDRFPNAQVCGFPCFRQHA